MSYQADAEMLAAAARSGASGSNRFYRDRAKRVIDVTVVLLAFGPVLLTVGLLAILIALDGANPFYSQRRVGRGGRVFRMWKLRTMVPDADAVLDAHLASDPGLRAHWDRHQKLPRDPRVTTIGGMLRKCSLDELPQVLNVLWGDMSLVGPRPMTEEQRAMYPGADYFLMRPGMTGLWQVSARHDSSFADRAWFDGTYFHSQSLRTDLGVLARTVGVVLRGTGC